MSFNAYKEIIEENDTVILHISFKKTHAIQVTPTKSTAKGEIIENVFQTSYGALKVKELIGKSGFSSRKSEIAQQEFKNHGWSNTKVIKVKNIGNKIFMK